MQQLLFVANWKMQLSFDRAIAFAQNNYNQFAQLSKNHSIVVCPSFDALASVKQAFADTQIKLGAQNVSAHDMGAYTGQVSAVSLKQIGCMYCIVGHSERRTYNNESDADVADKVRQLATAGVIPIICVGETREQRDQGQTMAVLKKQVNAILEVAPKKICIAYEPIWAIGTGVIPQTQKIAEVVQALESQVQDIADARFLYGGSVSPDNAAELATIDALGGFLIGGASIDFQKFKKIVSLEKA